MAQVQRHSIVYLVSCVSKKRARPACAKNLYDSELFKKARLYAEKSGHSWCILSAKYGLVEPSRVIAPYDVTLSSMPVDQRKRWARRVFAQLIRRFPNLNKVVFLAGAKYREYLVQHMHLRNILVSVPMEGLRLGEQLRWLEGRLHSASGG